MKITEEKGVTLLVLVTTIIILLILASVGVTSWNQTIEYSAFNEFTAELQVMQSKVNELNQNKNTDIGTEISENQKNILDIAEIRNIIFKNVLVIENQLKSVLSYQLSKKYGYKEKDYLNPKNFTNDHSKSRRVHDLIDKMKRQIRINVGTHAATMHYMNNYGYIPMWVLVKVLSFGIVCELYTILREEDKIEIAEVFNTTPSLLEDILVILSNYRNLCAHEDIVFEHRTERVVPDTEYHEYMNIPKMDGEYIYGKNDLFAVIIIFKILLNESNFRLMMKEVEYEIELLDGRIDIIPINKILDRMGFPKDYIDIIGR